MLKQSGRQRDATKTEEKKWNNCGSNSGMLHAHASYHRRMRRRRRRRRQRPLREWGAAHSNEEKQKKIYWVVNLISQFVIYWCNFPYREFSQIFKQYGWVKMYYEHWNSMCASESLCIGVFFVCLRGVIGGCETTATVANSYGMARVLPANCNVRQSLLSPI